MVHKKKITLIFVLFAALFLMLAVIGGIKSYSAVPFMDMWDGYLDFYVRASAGDWSAWWDQHNEHRIFLGRILFWIDLFFFDGQIWFLILINYLLTGLACLIFWKIWKERKAINDIPWMGFFLIAWLFYWAQENNLTSGFQNVFFLAQLLPLMALYFLHRAAAAGMLKWSEFNIAILCGLLATGSMANGVLALPLMTVYAVLVRMGWKRSFLLAILTIGVISLYFYNYKTPGGHSSLAQAFQEYPLAVIHYVLLYLGGPFYYVTGEGTFGQAVATIAGIFMIGSSLAFAWRVIPVAHKATLSMALLVFLLYIGGTALGTGAGRVIFGINQALSSRYITPTLMAWASLLMLFLPKLDALSQSARNRLWMPFLTLLLLMLPLQLKALMSKQNILFEREISALSLELSVNDQFQISNIYPSAGRAQSIAEIPVARNYTIFGTIPFRDVREIIGQKSTLINRTDHECLGFIDETQVIEQESKYVKLKGWIFNNHRGLVPKSFQLVDGDGVVQGLVLTGQSRPDVAKAINSAASNSGFKGYVRSDVQGKAVEFLSIEEGCNFSANIPNIQP